jgi:hypothetical protein
MTSLYEISSEYRGFFDLLDSLEGEEVSPEDQALLEAFLGDLNTRRDEKLSNIGAFVKNQEALGKARLEEAKRIKALGDVNMNKARRLKERVLLFFTAHGITGTIDTLRFKFRAQANGGVLPVIVDEDALADPNLLPPEYRRTVVVPDLEAIRRDLEAGVAMPLARLGERGQHLRIS